MVGSVQSMPDPKVRYGYVIDLVPHLFPLCRAGL